MNRRAFFASLLGAAAAAADPERLLWVPGRKVISIPKPVVLDPAWISTEALKVLRHRLAFARMVQQDFNRILSAKLEFTIERPAGFYERVIV